MPPLVSVLMTAYNRERYIAEAIESVLAQEFTDFELIIVDDGSKDRTVEIARRYLADQRVQVHVNEKNLGDYPNRNRAAELAQGRYLKYLDSDDVLYPFGLSAMVEIMAKYPDAALGLQRPSAKDRPFPHLLTPEQAYREHFVGGGLFGVGPTGAITLASAFRAAGCFSGKRFIGDMEFWLKLAPRSPVVKFMEGLVWWRPHGSGELQIGYGTLAQHCGEYRVQMEALTSELCPLRGSDRAGAIHWVKHRHARAVLRLALVKLQPQKAMGLMRETEFSASDLRFAFTSAKSL